MRAHCPYCSMPADIREIGPKAAGVVVSRMDFEGVVTEWVPCDNSDLPDTALHSAPFDWTCTRCGFNIREPDPRWHPVADSMT